MGVLGNGTALREEGASRNITPTTCVNYFRGRVMTDINIRNGIIGQHGSSFDSLWQESKPCSLFEEESVNGNFH